MTDTITAKGSKPTHTAYHVRTSTEGKGYWTRIGSAWAHRDGSGFNIQVDVVPLDGRITLQGPRTKRRVAQARRIGAGHRL